MGWGILMLVVGIGIGFVAFSALREPEVAAIGDAVSLTSGGTVKRAGRYNPGAPLQVAEVRVSQDMPPTAAQAAVEGWRDSGACVERRGRYFQKDGPADVLPYLLMYSNRDELIGIYQFSKVEKPSPWEHQESLQGGGSTIIDTPHWSLLVYFKNPAQACVTTDLG
jgi:hypothetical protein